MYRTLLLLHVFIYYSQCLSAQFFVVDKAPCPQGPGVIVDTIFHTPDKAMPFDRCFVLKYTLKGPQSLRFFAVTPVDKRGDVAIRRRDYRVFLRSGWRSYKRRKEARQTIPYSKFRIQRLQRLFTGIETYPKGKQTEVFLNMPPLDPGREYQITLISRDMASADTLLSVGRTLFEGRNEAKAKTSHRKNALLRNQRQIRFYTEYVNGAETYSDFTEFIRSHTIEYTFKPNPTVKEYRLFYVPKGSSKPDLNSVLSKDHTFYIRQKPSFGNFQKDDGFKVVNEALLLTSMTRKVEGNYPIDAVALMDTDGKPVSLQGKKSYDIYLLAVDYISGDRGVKNPTDRGHIKFDALLGELTIEDDEITFKEEAKYEENYVSNAPGPAMRYKAVKTLAVKLASLGETKYDCFDPSSIKALMQYAQTCNCEEGSKNLTLKDDYTRVLSLMLMETDGSALYRKIQLGIVSLKDPFSELKPGQYAERRGNLKISREQLEAVLEYGRKLSATQADAIVKLNGVLDCTLACAENLMETIVTASGMLKDIIDHETEIRDAYINRFTLLEANPSSVGATSVLDFVSESRLRIVPDFGFTALPQGILEKNSKELGIQDFSPYLGFHINFRPIDKNIPFRMVRYKSIWHRFSFMSGLTLRSLKIEGQREDLFGEKTLVSGFGFRLSNYIKIVGGGVF